jgi:hypothetical protein
MVSALSTVTWFAPPKTSSLRQCPVTVYVLLSPSNFRFPLLHAIVCFAPLLIMMRSPCTVVLPKSCAMNNAIANTDAPTHANISRPDDVFRSFATP